MKYFRGELTPYQEGSIRELWTISYPLILSILSVNVMTFVDRLILAQYNTQAMNAATVAVLAFSVFQYGAIGIASISEVFVGQYNGAQKLKKMGAPVWQMIWFSLLTALIFIPCGLFLGPYLIDTDSLSDGVPFFKTLMLFGPAFPLVAALSSFFIGQGRGKLVMRTTILSNILNVILDFVLIFGISNIIPAMGAKGAALATGIAQSIQVIILFSLFLKKSDRKLHGTNDWRFNPALFKQAIKIGIPSSLAGVFETCAWYVLASILYSISQEHLTIFTIGDSFFALFTVGFWGLQKGITTVAANYIGAFREAVISKVLQSGIKIVIIIMLIFIIPLFLYPQVLAKWFLNPDSSNLMNEELSQFTEIAMHWLWAYFLFDGLAWLFCGVLTAAGDTKFVMIMNGISAWAFCIIPAYFWVTYLDGSPVVSWIWCTFYAFMNAFSFFLRYKSKRWTTEQPLHVS